MNTVIALCLQRVNLRDVDVLVFTKNGRTESRRGEYLKQLKSNSVLSSSIDQVICKNDGFDGESVVWKCTAPHLREQYQLYNTQVSCEGWDGPGDKYVVAGSCQLTYDTRRVSDFDSGYGDQEYSSSEDDSITTIIVVTIFVLVLVVVIILVCNDNRHGTPGVVIGSPWYSRWYDPYSWRHRTTHSCNTEDEGKKENKESYAKTKVR